MKFGMNAKLGPLSFEDKVPMSEELKKMIDLEAQHLAVKAEKAAKELLGRRAKEIHAVCIFPFLRSCIKYLKCTFYLDC
jgi:ATP-dependent Zn protease